MTQYFNKIYYTNIAIAISMAIVQLMKNSEQMMKFAQCENLAKQSHVFIGGIDSCEASVTKLFAKF